LPLGMVNELGPELTSYKEVKEPTHRTIREDAMARESQRLVEGCENVHPER